MENRTQFTFYESFYKSLSRIRKDADRAKAYDAIARFALYGEEPDLDALPDSVGIAFDVARPNLEASRRKASGGSKSKRNKDNDKIKESSGKDNDKMTARCAEQEKDKEQDKEQDKDKDKEQMLYTSPNGDVVSAQAKGGGGSGRFSPPSLDEVAAYCAERNNGIDPQRFLDHYEANGWMVGKNRMKDWKAAVRTWEKNEYGGDKQRPDEAKSIRDNYELVDTGDGVKKWILRKD